MADVYISYSHFYLDVVQYQNYFDNTIFITNTHLKLMQELAIIIPAKNEAASLPTLIDRLHLSLLRAKITHHIIVIDDYSTDKTFQVTKKLEANYPVKVFKKQGKPGKAYAILEGAKHSTAPYLAFIDADLQYPPEALAQMAKLTETAGLVIARRKPRKLSWQRQAVSTIGRFITGRVLFNMPYDVQSGLKLFKRDIITHIREEDVSPWTIDIPLIVTANRLGYNIDEVEIEFAKRTKGESKIDLVHSAREIFLRTLKYRLTPEQPLTIHPDEQQPQASYQTSTMVGAGLIYKSHRYITHTQLPHHTSAIHTISWWQRGLALSFVGLCAYAIFFHSMTLAIGIMAVLSTIYFTDVMFNLVLVLRSLQFPPEISSTPEELSALKDKDLPTYTILCPLYKEAHMVPHFVESIAKLEWPKDKLDVILLLEEDDKQTIAAAQLMNLPSFVRILVVPDSLPKTKPKACNYGLSHAKGEYLVIFDAEDAPDPLQLKKVYAAFQKTPPEIKCIQAKLNYYNSSQNLLTRFFTAEYSLWFDVILTGLQSFQTTIPLGGTSNHFRTADLLRLQGWDPFNVTEDCDLGVRLFKQGARTAIVDSVTLEEANSDLGNWIRQRSRWIKGYMQTYLLHMRNPLELTRAYGWHSLIFQLTVGGKIAFLLINPLMWLLTVTYFVLYAQMGAAIEALFPSVIFYMAAISLVFGNFLFIYYYMIGLAKREQWSLLKYVLLVPFYWLAASYAAMIALYQLIVKPHYWEKTIHGLHLKKEELEQEAKEGLAQATAAVLAEVEAQTSPTSNYLLPFTYTQKKLNSFINLLSSLRGNIFQKLVSLSKSPRRIGGVLLIMAAIAANVLNTMVSIYLGNELQVTDFAFLNTFSSLMYLVGIPYGALTAAVNHRTAFLLGQYKIDGAQRFWRHLLSKAVLAGLVLCVTWIVLLPYTKSFLNFSSGWILGLFSLVIMGGITRAVGEGYLRGRMLFASLAVLTLAEPVFRLLATLGLVWSGNHELIVLSLPISSILATLLLFKFTPTHDAGPDDLREYRLSKSFFSLALVANLSAVAFFSLDNVLVAHFLSAEETGRYGLLGLLGKMIFFAGNLTASFILPLVAYREGQKKNSQDVLLMILALTAGLSSLAFISMGFILPRLPFAEVVQKMSLILGYYPVYGLGILLFTVSQVVVQYHLARKEYIFAISSFIIALCQTAALWFFHADLNQVVQIMFISGALNAVALTTLHLIYHKIKAPLANVTDFFDLFAKFPLTKKGRKTTKTSLRFLILNWRDTRHVWAGGAEAYTFELARGLVKAGHQATIFCGNDNKSPRYEVMDGVTIFRRGGFYTVYIWAALYYFFRFRTNIDVVIDSANGIPFLTPLYIRKPIYLLIHHIHQEVFWKHLPTPLAAVASLIESDLTPYLYSRHNLITVSESSKQDMIKIGLGNDKSIWVVNPGIHLKNFRKTPKTKHPSLVYVGRLKTYKRIDLAIRAFAGVHQRYPNAKFYIAGTGEDQPRLFQLAQKLNLESAVEFLGFIDDERKFALLSSSWMAVQPSMVEGWGITVIEANAAGTPVIAANVKGLRDSILDQETGLLVSATVADFEKAICTLIADAKLRQRLAKRALVWAEQFDWSQSVKKYLSIVASRTAEDPIYESAPTASAKL